MIGFNCDEKLEFSFTKCRLELSGNMGELIYFVYRGTRRVAARQLVVYRLAAIWVIKFSSMKFSAG